MVLSQKLLTGVHGAGEEERRGETASAIFCLSVAQLRKKKKSFLRRNFSYVSLVLLFMCILAVNRNVKADVPWFYTPQNSQRDDVLPKRKHVHGRRHTN